MLSKLSATLRTKTLSPASVMAVRGGKKKKGGGAAEAPTSSDIVNIWKDRQDPVIRPLEMYPDFVAETLKVKYSAHDVMFQLARGERMPDAKEQWTLAKSMRRSFLVDQNKLVKRDWEYESDDDEGEDLGQNVVVEEEYDELDEDAPPRQKTEQELLMEKMGLKDES